MDVFLCSQKEFTTQRAVILHAGWLDQACAHCPIFLTAASRRSRVRVSVPVWGTTLSRPLPIIDLVSRYLTNNLIGRTPISSRRNFNLTILWGIYSVSGIFPPAKGRSCTRYSPVRHSPSGKLGSPMLPFDLHVLSLPLAFILSQDQTLHSKFLWPIKRPIFLLKGKV